LLIIFLFDGVSAQSQKNNNTTIMIPVVFHFVDTESVTRDSLIKVISSINRRINYVNSDSIKKPFDKIIGSPNIILYLPVYDNDGNKVKSISHHTMSSSHTPHLDDMSLSSIGYLKSNGFLNIWIRDIIGNKIMGHTINKNTINGIIIDKYEWIENVLKEDQPWMVIHELGHWLGLEHIWGPNDIYNDKFIIRYDKIDDCFWDDGIDDTPKQKSPHFYKCKNIQDACGNKGKANHQNFMDYSYDVGMFTKGQAKAMRDYIKTKRPGLLWGSNFKNSTPASILSKTKYRKSQGVTMAMHYQFETSPPFMIEGFFNSTLGYKYNKESLKTFGLFFLGKGKFRDNATGETVTQKDIYERIDIEKAKIIIKNNPKHQVSDLIFIPSTNQEVSKEVNENYAKSSIDPRKTENISGKILLSYKSFSRIKFLNSNSDVVLDFTPFAKSRGILWENEVLKLPIGKYKIIVSNSMSNPITRTAFVNVREYQSDEIVITNSNNNFYVKVINKKSKKKKKKSVLGKLLGW